MKRWPVVAVAVLFAAPAPASTPPVEASGLAGVRTWAVYYGAAAAMAPALSRFDLVVLDPQRHPPLSVVKRRGARVVMYVSLGEVNVHHREYPAVADEPWVLGRNPNWPETRRLDVRDPACERWLLTRMVGAALADPEVNGLFLDTVDAPLGLESREPDRFGGMAPALERMILAIRRAHPGVLLVVNGGLPLVARLAEALDGVAIESVWTDYDFSAKRYRRRSADDAERRLAEVRRVADLGLPVLAIEYAPPGDRKWIRELIARAREQQFVPYVSTIRLNRVFTSTLGPAGF